MQVSQLDHYYLPNPYWGETAGEDILCPEEVVETAGFIERGGHDFAIEGPFIYMANDRGLDIIDLR